MVNTFQENCVEKFKEGLLLLVKYAIFIIVILYAYAFMNDVKNMASNGNQAALYLLELQKKGYLPAIQPNGQVPEKAIIK